MHLKLDENLPPDAAQLLRVNGFTASTVIEQGLWGVGDPTLAAKCRQNRQVIVTPTWTLRI